MARISRKRKRFNEDHKQIQDVAVHASQRQRSVHVELELSSSESEVEAELFYMEHQQEGRCGMRALNNALGQQVFTTQNMADAAAYYFQEWCVLDEHKHWHVSEDGWYSVDVLCTCLFREGYTLNTDKRIKTPCEARRCKGVIQNRRNRHWVAYRVGSDNLLYFFDSMDEFPEAITDENFMKAADIHPTFGITMEEGTR